MQKFDAKPLDGDFAFEVVKSARRTISISINRHGSVVIRTPKRISQAKVLEIVALKKQWILKKIAQISTTISKNINEDYKTSEILRFLGENYQIEFQQYTTNSVAFQNGQLCVKSKKERDFSVIEKWLVGEALKVFSQRLSHNFAIFSQKLEYNFPILKIRKMKSRWGSMLSGRAVGVMTLNLNLIHKPIECIDYVIMHELCHLKFPNHSGDFYNLQQSFVPNWRELKALL